MNITDAGSTLVFSDATPEEKKRLLSASKPAPAPVETLTRSQAAKIFGVHPGSLKRWEKSGKLRPIRITARTLRYSKAEILSMLGGVE